MHGLWNNIKSSVGETLDTIIASPKKLRKRASYSKETSVATSTNSNSSNNMKKMCDLSSSDKMKDLEEGGDKLQHTNPITATNPALINIQNTSSNTDSNSSIIFNESISSDITNPVATASGSDFRPIPRISTSSSSGSLANPNITNINNNSNNNNINSNSFVLKPKIVTNIPKRTNTLGDIGIDLVNDEGEHDSIEIDIADSEKIKGEDKNLYNARRQSISDRINRRRTSELAAEIIRLSAEHRKKEFFELLDEHEEIVKGIEVWKSTGVLPLTSSPSRRSNLETVADEDNDDLDMLEDETFEQYRRQNPNPYYLTSSSPEDKENKTLPRSH